MPVYLTPGAYFEAVDAAAERIRVLRTDVAGFVGLAERGPLDTPVRIDTFEQFQAVFGSFLRQAYLAYAVKAFFENGGDACFVVRVADGAAAAGAVLLDANGVPTLRVAAPSPGAWGNGLRVLVAHSSAAATGTGARPQPLDRLSSFVESLNGFPPGSLVKIFQPGPPNPVSTHRTVVSVNRLTAALAWDASLPAALDLARPFSLEAVEFSVSVSLRGQLRAVLPGLSLVPEHPRYAGRAAAADALPAILFSDQLSPSPYPENLPAPGWTELTGGKDGLAALNVFSFTGDPGATVRRGLRAFESVDEVAILAMPDILVQPVPDRITDPPPEPQPDPCLPGEAPQPPLAALSPPPEQAPLFSLEDVLFMQQALLQHCETLRDRFAILDMPAPPGGGLPDLGQAQDWRNRFDSRFGAFYLPSILVLDPLDPGSRAVRAVPPSGHIAGVFARNDRERGVHSAPANLELRWAQALTADLDAAQQSFLNPLGINCLRVFPGRGIRVFGARTATLDGQWRYVNVRRLMSMIEEALDESLQWSVFEPNSSILRQTIHISIAAFLEFLWQRGALVGAVAEEAFRVKCDAQNNTADMAELGQLLAEVSVAPVVPAEFVVFRIGRTEGELEISE